MKIDHTAKTITASSWELFAVTNYLNRCLTNEERKTWKVNIVTRNNTVTDYKASKDLG